MSKKQIKAMFQAFVFHVYDILGDKDQIKDILLTIADDAEIRELGFGDYLDYNSMTDD